MKNYKKTYNQIKEEYLTVWDNLKEDDIITYDNFQLFFKDISTCIIKDEDFEDVLKSLGLK